MKVNIIRTIKEFEALRDAWDDLLSNSYKDVIYLSHEWVMAWWNSFGEPNKMHIAALYNDNDEIIGIAPLMEVSCKYRSLNIKKISLMVNGHSPSSDFIIRKGNGPEAVKAILTYLEEFPNVDIIELSKLDSSSYTYSTVLDYLKMNSNKFGIKDSIETPFISINSDWEAFLSNKSQKFRKSLRNKLNRAKKTSNLSIEKIQIKDSKNPAIQEMFAVSEKSWKREEGTDITSNPRSRNFYIEICDRLGPQGITSLWFLRKGATPIAFEFHLTHNDVVYPIRADYDESFNYLSPGSILEFNIIKTLFEDGKIKEYNTCGHSYNYLMNWSEDTRKHVRIEIFSNNYKSHILYNLEYGLIHFLKKRLRLNKVK